jgi:Phosphoglucose isomerase
MLAIGPENFRALLDGFHQMDEHFRTAPFERNLPVLMGLLAVFDHRGSFQVKLFGWAEALTDAQTAEIAATKQVIFWEPLVGSRAKKTSRETAVADSPSLRGVRPRFRSGTRLLNCKR